MIDTSQTHSNDTDTAAQSPGTVLARARRKAKLTQEQVAAELNIQLNKIQALEADEVEKLFSPVFTRGYIRNYAKLLKLDHETAETLVQRYERDFAPPADPLPPVTNLNVKIARPHSPWPVRLVIIAVFVILWALVYWYFSDTPSDAEPSALAPSAAPVHRDQSHSSSLAAHSRASTSAGSVPHTASSAPATAAPVKAAASAPKTDEPVSSSLASGQPTGAPADKLALSFAHKCWIEITDAQGQVLARQLQQANSQFTVTGRAPFNVKLGDSQGVVISLNNQPVDIPRAASGTVVNVKVGTNG